MRRRLLSIRREKIPGKRQSGEINAALPRDARSGNHLLYAVDSNDSTRWLIDGGALWSILPPTPQQRSSGPNAWKLQAANGSEIPCYGLADRQVCIADRTFDFTFIIADVRQSILGADFLNRFYLAPNHRDKCLIDLNDWSFIPCGRHLQYPIGSSHKHQPRRSKNGPFLPTPRQLPVTFNAVIHAKRRITRHQTPHPD